MEQRDKKSGSARKMRRNVVGDRTFAPEKGSWRWHEIARHAASTSRHPLVKLHLIAHEYHQLRSERVGIDSSAARKHEARMQELARQFDRLADRWIVRDADLHEWEEYFYHTGPEPDGPEIPVGPVFAGRSAAGEEVVVREGDDGYFVVILDGDLVERLPSPWQPGGPSSNVVLVGREFRETFRAPIEACAALVQYAQRGSEPPWHMAVELYGDGLIDENFAFTPRGRRCVAEHC